MATEREQWVAVGKLGRTFGLRGEIVVHYYGDTAERFTPGARLFLATSTGRRELVVASARRVSKRLAVSFAGCERIEDVQDWVGAGLEVPAADLPPLEEGRYYHHQLIGLRVFAADGRCLGAVAEILATPGNDVYCVRGGQREILVPAVDDAIAAIDLEAGTLTLRDLAGLIEP